MFLVLSDACAALSTLFWLGAAARRVLSACLAWHLKGRQAYWARRDAFVDTLSVGARAWLEYGTGEHAGFFRVRVLPTRNAPAGASPVLLRSYFCLSTSSGAIRATYLVRGPTWSPLPEEPPACRVRGDAVVGWSWEGEGFEVLVPFDIQLRPQPA